MGFKKLDIVGKKFGRLTVLAQVGTDKHSKCIFLCECECGNQVRPIGANIVRGQTKSCGCIKIGLKRTKRTHCSKGHEFTPENTYRAKSGSRHCRECRKLQYELTGPRMYDPVKAQEFKVRAIAKNKDYFRHYHLKTTYNITIDDYNRMWKEQHGKCDICNNDLKQDKTTHVDHNHTTGQVRSLLCQTCNHGVGAFKDDPEIAESAARYLRKYQEIYELQSLL